ncbi:MAG TPA: hypothetical protein VJK48_03665 [Chlamydiales bacterium]|nr:hypothetical protein [Chlamydiales bacterium]
MQSKWNYPNGAIYALIEEKKRTFFYETGQMKTIEEYCEGKLEGQVLLFWPNGQLKRKSYFSCGYRQGSDQIWDESGQLRDEGIYEEGQPIGTHKRWNRKGILVEEILFLGNGRCNFKRWDEEGQFKAEGIWSGLNYLERKWDQEQKKWIETRVDG